MTDVLGQLLDVWLEKVSTDVTGLKTWFYQVGRDNVAAFYSRLKYCIVLFSAGFASGIRFGPWRLNDTQTW